MTIRNCSDLCSVLFSDLCHCCTTLYTPSLAHDCQPDCLPAGGCAGWALPSGQQLVLGNSMLWAVRPVLELLEVDWAEEEDTSNNLAINHDTGAIKVRHLHLHLPMYLYLYIYLYLYLHLHLHL